MKKVLHIVMVLLCAPALVARYHSVTSERSFENLVNKYPLAVVCFAESRPENKEAFSSDERKEIREDFKDLKTRVKGASDSGRYKKYLEREVGFLLVDVASGKTQEIDDEFSIDQFPTCLLFKRGHVYKTANAYAKIFGDVNKDSILSLLEKHFDQDIEKIIEQKREEEKLEREERIERYKAYTRWGYPYHGWGWGWGYPHYGYGWGWGGYGHWRRGCW